MSFPRQGDFGAAWRSQGNNMGTIHVHEVLGVCCRMELPPWQSWRPRADTRWLSEARLMLRLFGIEAS